MFGFIQQFTVLKGLQMLLQAFLSFSRCGAVWHRAGGIVAVVVVVRNEAIECEARGQG